MNQQQLNNFKREYFDLRKKLIPNAIIHDPNTAPEHRRIVNEICEWLRSRKNIFYTRVYLKEGEIVDIVAPELPRPFIEVRHTELEKNKEYLSTINDLRIFVDTNDPWKLL